MLRREFIAATGLTGVGLALGALTVAGMGEKMYGQIAKITAISGKRDELISVLIAGTKNMPGCLSYVIAEDATEPDAVWISEAWENKESHDSSLGLPSVKDSLTKGRSLIAAFSNRVITTPIGGTGLEGSKSC